MIESESTFIQALHADAPSAERADKLSLYGWLVGSWDMHVSAFSPDGKRHEAAGKIYAGWILEGRALQDVWTIPRSGTDPFPVAGNWCGTTVRTYDPSIDAWQILWIDPATNTFRKQIGRAQDGRIVQIGTTDGVPVSRWSFLDIQPRSFRWLGEGSTDGGVNWRLFVEIRATRIE
ncbi:MAG TPA: hypothetical protein VK636_15520 [Gemmatimonadaceae bacterium]|nr:hypothetical protein [Gemmatimonadaceae bacterium]